MRIRKIEFVAIALTVAFACFMGGYFTGSRGSVNVIAVEQQHGESFLVSVGEENNQWSPEPQNGTEPLQSPFSEAPGQNVSAPSDTQAEQVNIEQAAALPGAPRGDGRININTASRTELTDLPGIGNVLAGRIVDYRTQHGAFSRIDDIKRVSGIGEKRFEAIQDKITVGG